LTAKRLLNIVLFLSILTGILFLTGAQSATGEPGVKTLPGRQYDAIVIKGDRLAPLDGVSSSCIRLIASNGASVHDIPFQVDEYDPSGEMIMRSGKNASSDKDDGALDANDDFVFLANYMGPPVDRAQLPRDAKSWVAIKATDPINAKFGWAYAGAFETKVKHSTVDLVSYMPRKDMINGKLYTEGFLFDFPFIKGALHLRPGAGGPNLLDRLQVRLTARAFGKTLVKTEEDFKAKLTGYIDGPVRVVRQDKSRLALLAGISGPAVTKNLKFYPNWNNFQVPVNVPFNPKALFKEITLFSGYDLNIKPSMGMYMVTGDNPGVKIPIRGKPDFAADGFKGGKVNWVMVEGPAGGVITTCVPEHPFPIEPELFFLDDLNADRSPDKFPGAGPTIGFVFNHLETLEGGNYKINYYTVYREKKVDNWHEGFIRMLNDPLKVKTSPL